MKWDSSDIAKASIQMAISSRNDEQKLINDYKNKEILTAAVNIGGDLITSIPKVVERAIIASRRSGITIESHSHDGGVAGATREAIMQVAAKATGFNVGGKIGIARYKEHLCVCVFASMGLLHFNEVVIGLGHRIIAEKV
jgi:hypothetical protein